MAFQNQELPLDDSPLLDGRWLPPGKMTEEQFVAWCDEDTRAEWVDGEVVMMSPANYEHVALSRWLVNVIGLFVEQRDLGEIFEEFQLRLPSQRRRRTPDLCFLAKDRLHLIRPTHLEGAPDLIFEIVSPDSQASAYRRREPADAAISSTVLPGFRLRIDWLWPQTRPKVLDALRELGVLGSPPK